MIQLREIQVTSVRDGRIHFRATEIIDKEPQIEKQYMLHWGEEHTIGLYEKHHPDGSSRTKVNRLAGSYVSPSKSIITQKDTRYQQDITLSYVLAAYGLALTTHSRVAKVHERQVKLASIKIEQLRREMGAFSPEEIIKLMKEEAKHEKRKKA